MHLARFAGGGVATMGALTATEAARAAMLADELRARGLATDGATA